MHREAIGSTGRRKTSIIVERGFADISRSRCAASFHAVYDHGTAHYLRQAGVNTELVRLEQRGIHGNAHLMMLEKNNLPIARLIKSWLGKHLREAEALCLRRLVGRGFGALDEKRARTGFPTIRPAASKIPQRRVSLALRGAR